MNDHIVITVKSVLIPNIISSNPENIIAVQDVIMMKAYRIIFFLTVQDEIDRTFTR